MVVPWRGIKFISVCNYKSQMTKEDTKRSTDTNILIIYKYQIGKCYAKYCNLYDFNEIYTLIHFPKT